MLHSKQIPQTGADEEWLSALLDGELDDAEGAAAVTRLAKNPAQSRRWAEYCLIGDALRGQALAQGQLARRMHSALEAEPTVLAPMPRPAQRQPLMWVAAAASVAAVTWTLWSEAPRQEAPLPLVRVQEPALARAPQMTQYLAAHQDYAQVVIANPEMEFTRVTLTSMEGGR